MMHPLYNICRLKDYTANGIKSMAVVVRPATVADQPAIRRIVRQARINPTGLAWPRFVVAEAEGQVGGTGQVKPHRDGSRELASIATVPEMQRRGVARQIIEALL